MTNPPPGSVPPAGQPPPGYGGYSGPAPGYQQPGYSQPGYPPQGTPAQQPAAQSQASEPPAGTGPARVRRTRISALWVGLIIGALFLLLLIVFIAQNSSKVSVHFLGFSGRISLGLALLVAAAFGLLIAAVPGTIRIVQLRNLVRRGGTAPR